MDGISVKIVARKKTEYTCPLCGCSVSELPNFFGCDNFRIKNGGCKYKIYKNMYDVPIPNDMLKDLLTNGETKDKLDGFYDKHTKQPIKARLKYDPESNLLMFADSEPSDFSVNYEVSTSKGTFATENFQIEIVEGKEVVTSEMFYRLTDKFNDLANKYNRLIQAYYEDFKKIGEER